MNDSIARKFIVTAEFPLNFELGGVFYQDDSHHRERYILNRADSSNMTAKAGKLQ